jgi:leucyl/phenylalanyl-tRNA--protein transferase
MRQFLRKSDCVVKFDTASDEVFQACQQVYPRNLLGSWINEELLQSLSYLHKIGVIHTVEVWRGDSLVGGLYGAVFGKCFYGESMFSRETNASKIALITLAQNLSRLGYHVIDCQFHTDHLESMGGEFISRDKFLEYVFSNSEMGPLPKVWSRGFSSFPHLSI